MIKIALCGEIYSQNLGDGVIADSLTWLLKQVDVSVVVSHIDISGRQQYNTRKSTEHGVANRIMAIHSSLAQIPMYRRGVALPAWYAIKRSRFNKLWRDMIADCDMLIIGGGQLLMDNDLGFPLSIRELVRIACSLNKRIAFYSCGVGRKWTWLGLDLLSEALLNKNTRWISVRDYESRDSLNGLFTQGPIVSNVSLDPAICAAEAYGRDANTNSDIIGLGISAPVVLRRHGFGAKSNYSKRIVRQFWLDLAKQLEADRRKFRFFTNGQPEDYEFAKAIVASMSHNKQTNSLLMERAVDPPTLVNQISQFNSIVSHRLHANIIAYSLGIPSIGLVWDKKVEAFGNITERSSFFFSPSDTVPYIVKRRLYDALDAGVDVDHRTEIKAQTFNSVQNMLHSIGKVSHGHRRH